MKQSSVKHLLRAGIPALFLFALLLSGLSGCDGGRQRADLVFANGAEPESLDPHTVTGQPEIRLCEALFEGLTTRSGEGKIVPGLAERWEISPDGRTYTFHLRESAWSNGDRLTSLDFVESWRRAMSPVTASGYADFYYPIVNAQAYNEGKIDDFAKVGVSAPDEKTLVVQLVEPTPYFPDICACSTLAPVHLESMKKWGEDWIKPGHLVSNGPFVLESWRLNDRVRLRKNPRYWNAAAVRLETVDALSLSSATTAFNLFHSGLCDLILDKSLVPSFFIDVLRTKPYFHPAPILGDYFYRLNVTRKPLSDPRVRQALALAVDKRRIVERITRSGEPTMNTFVPPGFADRGYPYPAGLAYDPEKARALLAQAGYPGGKGFPLISILYNSSEQNEQIATEIQAIWKENLGINVTLRNQEWKVYLNSMSSLDFDIARSSWVADYPDPTTFLNCFETGNGNNRTGWSSPAYDGLLAAARREPDMAKRLDLLARAESILVEKELPVIPLYQYVTTALYHAERLDGFTPNPIDDHPIRDMAMKPKSGQGEGRP
ncbi:oligopeptide transport system substrate-binding protein [Verrucomicrobium sp. GAS474]|uniref:peptide ABC transporter substrate-binding protein n=1 Tax=Verrucomicrobium sp. GAS474 TaxID=1882831 RepID=UPI00087936EF|nr:peptide ABC transporter substrate-binding protein [Verrucomicrobium sp. GAS474]SDU21551.1 oligopeptide transport system substrate-binding protein [Verrucomicrobium sp. GAS474]